MVSSFHPELSDDTRLHELFLRRTSPTSAPDRDLHLRSQTRRGEPDVRSFQVGHHQAQEGRGRQAKRGKLFGKLIRQVEVAARSGGGDLDMNPTLRTMYQKARSASVPLDTIEKAIKRATGDMDGVIYEADHLRGLRAPTASPS